MENTERTGTDWRTLALTEIASVKQHFICKYQWQLTTREEPDKIVLFVRMQQRHRPEQVRVLKLTYGPEFPSQRPREGFVDPTNYDNEGLAFWMDDGNRAFKSTHTPPVICLEGTWGFHHILHKERDPLRVNLTKLLLEVQQCFTNT